MTTRQPSPNARFSAFLSRFPPGIVALVKRCLPKLRRAFPVSHELVYDYSAAGVSKLFPVRNGRYLIAKVSGDPDEPRERDTCEQGCGRSGLCVCGLRH